MILTKDLETFEKEVKTLIEKGKEIEQKYNRSYTQEDYDQFVSDFNDLRTKALECFSNSFDKNKNSYSEALKSFRGNHFNFGAQKKELRVLFREKQQEIKSFYSTFNYFLKLIKVSDIVIQPELVNAELRKNFTTNEILNLLLNKLYVLFDDSYYAVLPILEGNGIQLKRTREEFEIVRELEDRGLVKSNNIAREADARLTLQGKLFVEETLKEVHPKYNKIPSEQETLNKKIDQIIKELKEQSLGQQILFEELEELKELNVFLSNKGLGQVLKGKLVDLGISKVINYDLASYIYQRFTDELLRLV